MNANRAAAHPSLPLPEGQGFCPKPSIWHGAVPNPTLLFRLSYCMLLRVVGKALAVTITQFLPFIAEVKSFLIDCVHVFQDKSGKHLQTLDFFPWDVPLF